MTTCSTCGLKYPEGEVHHCATKWSPMHSVGRRVGGYIGVFILLSVVVQLASPALGAILIENTPPASIAFVVGYYLPPKRSHPLSNRVHWLLFAGLLIASAVIRTLLSPSGELPTGMIPGVLFLVEAGMAWVAFKVATRR